MNNDVSRVGYGRRTEHPGAICKTFQSTSMPLVLKMARASSAIASNPPVARASIVGPAPERQIPNNPGCVSGVMFDVTSGKPGIWIKRALRLHELQCSLGDGESKNLPILYGRVDVRDPSSLRR